jgi:transmembrane sensor
MNAEIKPEQTMNEGIFDIIIRQLKGLTNSLEEAMLANWLNESEENKRAFDEISDIWTATAKPDKRNPFDSKIAFENVKRQIGLTKRKSFISFWRNANFYKIAAGIIISFGLGFLVNKLLSEKQLTNSDVITQVTAPIGSKSKVVLPDGTNVWLNSGSTICYNSSFNKIKREIKLEGEAFFDVHKNKNLPFVIQTSNSLFVKVLGTAFNLKAYSSENFIETTLERGSLIVERTVGDKIYETKLVPKQRATFNKVEKKMQVSIENDPTIFSAWRNNELIFRNEPFESLVIKLERWYGVSIIIKDKEIKYFHFNGTIQNESITDVMNIIKYTLPINYTLAHNQIVISKKH